MEHRNNVFPICFVGHCEIRKAMMKAPNSKRKISRICKECKAFIGKEKRNRS
ncbi:MAG: hypothetical protein ABIF22_03170 [bacterium]